MVAFAPAPWTVERLRLPDRPILDRELMLSGGCARECLNPNGPVAPAAQVVPVGWVAKVVEVQAVPVAPDMVVPWGALARFAEVRVAPAAKAVQATTKVVRLPQTQLVSENWRKSPRT